MWDMEKMLLSPQHSGFGDQQEMLLTIPPKIVDHTCLKYLTMLIYKADSRSPKGGKITGKGKIRTGKLDFEDVYFVKELKFNLFSVSQMCDKKNSVLFTETECLVLSPDFKLLDESQVLLKVPRQNNMYSFDLKNVVPSGGSPKGGKIIVKGKIRTGKLHFEDVYFIKELKFNLFSVSQMCDKKNSVLFTETECLVLSPFKLLDESQVLLKVPLY
ncbi:hypothetical protein Tco_0983054 [Tanacetum coccineum]